MIQFVDPGQFLGGADLLHFEDAVDIVFGEKCVQVIRVFFKGLIRIAATDFSSSQSSRSMFISFIAVFIYLYFLSAHWALF